MPTIPGINIQWPWSELIVEGIKSIETRHYPLPKKYIGQKLALIQTPGPKGKKEAGLLKSQIIGTIIFAGDFKYRDEAHWRKDIKRHCVSPEDPHYGYAPTRVKWGWVIDSVEVFPKSKPVPKKRGIVFASVCEV